VACGFSSACRDLGDYFCERDLIPMEDTGSRTWLVALGGLLGIVVVVCLVVVFVPPFHLLERLQDGNYTSLTAENPVATHEDGIQILAAPSDLDASFSVLLDSVPQLSFLEGSAGEELRRAAESLPANLVVKSPYYRISTKGTAPESTIIAVGIPNNAEPWETLDLYTWTGQGWQWVGGRVDTSRELILAQVGQEIPESVVVMQVEAISPGVSTALPANLDSTTTANSGVTHLFPTGLLLGDMGGITGNPAGLLLPTASDSFALVPSIRNWTEETGEGSRRVGNVDQNTLTAMLANPGIRQAHKNNLVALAVGQGYAGIDLDYRGVSADWRDTYSEFVADVADALHAQGKTLSVAVEVPSPTGGGGWDTRGYDWHALGRSADIMRAPFADNLASLGGQAQDYMSWALSQVSRYKLFPILSTYSSDQVDAQVVFLAQGKALAPLSNVTGPDDAAVAPGDTVRVDLGGEAVGTLQQDGSSQSYTYIYHDEQGVEHRVTVVTAASLAKMLDSVMRYHLGGVFVVGLLEPGNDPALAEVVRQFANRTPPTAADRLEVVWTVQDSAGGQLARVNQPFQGNNSFEWTTPGEAGEYLISALIGPAAQSGEHGSFTVSVGTSASTIASTTVVTPTATPTPSANPPAVAGNLPGCLNSAYVADLTVPDNTHFEKGEAFVKTWRVRNSGSCAWPDDTQLVFVRGSVLGAPQSVSVGALEVGGTTDISVDMVAPDTDGGFSGNWRLAYGGGNPFGTNLTVVIKAGAEPTPNPQQPAPAPPPPRSGGGFQLGGHIRTWNYVAQMKQAGMSWAKVQIHFGQDAAGLVNAAHSNGLKMQLSALGTPGMVTQPNFNANFSAWVASLAAAGADAIEVWNEPNIDREWQIGQINAAAYTQLLCASYSAIKAANPNTAVISAAPAPTGYFGGCSGNGCDDLPFLQGMYNAGAANCMDYIGAHHNSGATSPSARSGHPADNGGHHHSWYFLPQTELYYNVFGGSRKLFYTEMGYASQEGLEVFSDQFAWARGTNNAQQAAWLAEAVTLSRSTGMVSNIIVWNIDFPRYGYDPQDGYAIIRPGGSCPACDALRAAMQ
jgi:spore germination protein YaaH